MKTTLASLLVLAAAGCTLFSAPRPVREDPAMRPPFAEDQGPSRPNPYDPEGGEVRALWVVRSTLTRPSAVRTMVERAHRSGFNSIIVQVRGRGDAFYRSATEPRSHLIPETESFDPLALTIELAHERGIAVHAWMNVYLVWSGRTPPNDPVHVVRTNPDWLAVPRSLAVELYDSNPYEPRYVERLMNHAVDNSSQVEGVYLSPANAEVKARLVAIMLELEDRYDLDGIHFDYVRLPRSDFDYSRASLEAFARWVGPRLGVDDSAAKGRIARGELVALADGLPLEWGEFQRSNITELVRWMYFNAKAQNPNLVVSAAVRAGRADARDHRYQDWGAWAREGILDVTVPMAYTSSQDRFRTFVVEAVREAGRERIWVGLGVYLNSTENTLAQIDIVRDYGARGLVLFSYDWAVGEGYRGSGPDLLQVVAAERFR